MPSINEDIRQWLISCHELASLSERIYLRRLPQEVTFPAVTFMRVSNKRHYSHSGFSGLHEDRYQFTIWSQSPDETETLGDALFEAMESFPYNDGQGVFNMLDQDIENPEAKLFMRVLDFKIWHH